MNMADSRTSIFDVKVVIGIIVLIFGILLFLRNLGYDIGMSLWSYWPIILIILGLRIIFQPRVNRQLVTGAILAIVGVLLILHNLDILHFGWGIIWPLLIILIGISIIAGHFRHPGGGVLGKDHIDLSMVLGGGDFRFESKELRGGKISAIMGGGQIDLRNADMIDEEIVIDVFTLMGGIELSVPTAWQVLMRGTPLLGGMDNQTVHHTPDCQAIKPKRLVITGTAILGGIEVKN
jgi:predicted membrane protein